MQYYWLAMKNLKRNSRQMAKLPAAFNTNDHGEMMSFEAIPTGEYYAQVVKSSMEDTKNKDGKYLKLELDVLGPTHKGRKLFANLNLINKSAKAVEIANNELATICRACGKVAIQDSAELHGIPMKIKVRVVADNRGDDFPPKNEISGYSKADGQDAPASGSKEGSGKKKMPWE